MSPVAAEPEGVIRTDPVTVALGVTVATVVELVAMVVGDAERVAVSGATVHVTEVGGVSELEKVPLMDRREDWSSSP